MDRSYRYRCASERRQRRKMPDTPMSVLVSAELQQKRDATTQTRPSALAFTSQAFTGGAPHPGLSDALSSLVSRPRRHRLRVCRRPARLRRVLSRVKSFADGHRVPFLQGEHSFPWRVRQSCPSLHPCSQPPHHHPRVHSDTSIKSNMDSQPAAKKRKIAPIGPSNSQPNQSSFADVLQRLKDDAGESRGPSPITLPPLCVLTISPSDAEGGADRWARPPLPHIDVQRDSIGMSSLTVPASSNFSLKCPSVSQQIEIEDSVDQQTGNTTLRMFGVTEARPLSLRLSHILVLIPYCSRSATVSSLMSPTSSLTSTLLLQEVL